jgi:tetratricopeptide (TPR) repeat protein
MTPEDHSGGPMRCEQLGPFVDGELLPEEAAAFRKHLVACPRCQQEMHGLMQLSGLAEQARVQRPAEQPGIAPVVIAAQDRRARPRRAAWMGVVGAVAITAAMVLAIRGHSTPPVAPNLLASLDTRNVSGWPSALGPSAHRPYATVRGTTAPAPAALARAELQAEASGSVRDLATISLLRRDFQRADSYLTRLPESPATLSDRGLVLMEQSRCDEALEYFDQSLRADPGYLPAQFNRGLCLRTLGLPQAAVREFAGVARANAGGWSSEASADERAAEETIARQQKERAQILEASQLLTNEQRPPDQDILRRFPSSLRSGFYLALASTGTREELERLRKVARELDAAFGGDFLERHVIRALRDTSARRASLSRRFDELRRAASAGTPPGPGEAEHLLADARQSRQSDIALETFESFLFTDTGAVRASLVNDAGDPWFRVTLAYARAHQLTGAGRLDESERVLRAAQRECGSESMTLSCYWTHLELFEVYSQQGRMAEALREAKTAAADVRREFQPDYERKALLKAAEVQTASGQVASARALFEELIARQPERCAAAVYMMESLAEAYVASSDADSAAQALASAPACEFPQDPWRVALRLRLALLQGDREGIARSKTLADQLAATSGLRPEEVEQARLLSAMASVELQEKGAAETLHRMLERSTDGDPGREVRSRRADARATLIFDALRRSDPGRGLSELASLLGTSRPERCALGLVEDVGRLGWISLDAQGNARSEWKSATTPRASPAVAPEVREAFHACKVVDVLATGSLQGVEGVLPDEIAWRYRLGEPLPSAPQAAAPRRLVVQSATPPADLRLSPLGTSGLRSAADWTVLEGRDATPVRVLDAMRSASVVDLEVHGWVDPLVSDGAALALSEDGQGRYALTPSMLRPGLLTARPLVMLGACRAAQGSPFRKEPWSLPNALVGAGAGAVLASRSDLPDAEVGSFFDRIRRRVEAGAAPAVALRDERLADVRLGRDWVRSVVVFESPVARRGSP